MSDRNHEPKATLATLAASHDHLDQAHRSPRCMHVKANGVRCGSPAMRRSPYCFFHDRIYLEPADDLFPPLEDPNAVQVALMRVLERLRREALRPGPLDLRAVNSLLYGLQTAAFNSKRTSFDSFTTRRETVTDDPILSDREERQAAEAAGARKPPSPVESPDSLGTAPAAPRQSKPACVRRAHASPELVEGEAEGAERNGSSKTVFRQR